MVKLGVVPIALLLVTVSSVTAQTTTNGTTVPPGPGGGTGDPLMDLYGKVGKDCGDDTACKPYLTCVDKFCDCKDPDDKTDCSCNFGMLKYRRWVLEDGICKLTYGQRCTQAGQVCAKGLKCEGLCKTDGASMIYPDNLVLISLCPIIFYIIWSQRSSAIGM